MPEDKKEDDKNVFLKLADSKDEDINMEEAKEDLEEGQLTVDVFKDGDDVVIQSAIAGIDPEDLDINITDESVTIKGERSRDKTIEDQDFFYQECFWGQFSRSIILPEEVDPEEAEAKFSKNGILTIRMPVLKKSGSSKKLEVKTGDEDED